TRNHSSPSSASASLRSSGSLVSRISHIQAVVYVGVAVDQDVAKSDDATVLADPRGDGRIEFDDLRQSFADDLELPLDCRTQHGIALIVVEALTRGKLRDPRGGLLDVVQVLLGVK